MYHLNIYQPKDYPIIEIRIARSTHPLAGFLSAQKGVDFESLQLGPARVYASIIFRDYISPDEAEENADWWRLVAHAARLLDTLVKSREDLDRPITARMMGRTIVIDFEKQTETDATDTEGQEPTL